MANYGISKKINGTLDEVKPRVLEALKSQGFGILTEIDVQKTFKQKIDVDFKPYQILGACNPRFAYRALSVDDEIGLLLPCNVVLKQDDDWVVVSIQDPEVMFSVVDEKTKASMAGFPQEVKRSLQSALDALK
ncbi:MAG: ABC transporter ATP-binding protein [Chloroflexi bacterium RBG_19FT_COMBO_47_9]|nr:MAG: ABC transporter ATP-binding protein [Chloroflexi bacterium RBG_19FT_COMBO_47_9]